MSVCTLRVKHFRLKNVHDLHVEAREAYCRSEHTGVVNVPLRECRVVVELVAENVIQNEHVQRNRCTQRNEEIYKICRELIVKMYGEHQIRKYIT